MYVYIFMLHWLMGEATGGCMVPLSPTRLECVRSLTLMGEATGGCMIPPERKDYKRGKLRARTETFALEQADFAAVTSGVRQDVNWLRQCGLMDYSLIVGIMYKECNADGSPPSFPPGGAGLPGQPFVTVEGKRATAYYIGVIDFLQGWTGGKKCAHVIKWLFAPKPISTIEPAAYADQFLNANDRRFRTVAPRARNGRGAQGGAVQGGVVPGDAGMMQAAQAGSGAAVRVGAEAPRGSAVGQKYSV